MNRFFSFRFLLNLVLLLWVVALDGARADEIGWAMDHEAALEQARKEQKPVLLYFTAAWCGYCRMMEETTFSDPAVVQAVNPYLKVRLDYDDKAYLVARYGLRGVPAVILLNPEGALVATNMGYHKPEIFRAWLDRHAAGVSPELAKRAQISRDESIQEIETQLASDDPGARKRALDRLFEKFTSDPDAMLEYVRPTLDHLADNDPGLLAAFLTHPRLAVRLLTANALRQKLGDEFTVDPWDQGPENLKAIATWRARLGDPAQK